VLERWNVPSFAPVLLTGDVRAVDSIAMATTDARCGGWSLTSAGLLVCYEMSGVDEATLAAGAYDDVTRQLHALRQLRVLRRLRVVLLMSVKHRTLIIFSARSSHHNTTLQFIQSQTRRQ